MIDCSLDHLREMYAFLQTLEQTGPVVRKDGGTALGGGQWTKK